MNSIKTIASLEENGELISSEVLIMGDACDESIIDTHKLTLQGTTTPSSTQFSKYASIYKHQGTLRCHEAKITLLDGGEIHATSINVDTAQGGSMYAQDVTIKHLTGNATIYASHSINIEHISGQNNKLFIDYREVPILMSKIDLIKDDIQELQASLRKAQNENSTLEKDIKVELSHMKQEIQDIENSSTKAKVTIEKLIKTKNTISFQATDNDNIIYETENKKYSTFYLDFDKSTVTLKPTSKTLILS